MEMASESSRRNRNTESKSSITWWKQQVLERPLTTVGTVVSAVGGIVLLVFFCQLGFIPELDLAGASAILMAVAAVGVVLSFSLICCALAAGLILQGNDDQFNDLRTPKAIWSLVLPGWLSTVAFSLYAYIVPEKTAPNWIWYLPLFFIAIFALIYATLDQKINLAVEGSSNGLRLKIGRGLSYLLVSGLWLFAAGAALLTFVAIYPRDGSNESFLFGLILWTTWCYFSNFLLVKTIKNKMLTMISFCCIASLVILLAVSSNWAGVSVAAVRVLGLGEIPVVLVLTAEGCDQLNKAGGQTVCRVAVGEKTATVCPAILRSRIGSPFFIGLSPYDEKGYWPQTHPTARLASIAIPKSEVSSWSRLEPMAVKKAASNASSESVVTYLNSSNQASWVHEQCGETPQPSSGDSKDTSAPKGKWKRNAP